MRRPFLGMAQRPVREPAQSLMSLTRFRPERYRKNSRAFWNWRNSECRASAVLLPFRSTLFRASWDKPICFMVFISHMSGVFEHADLHDSGHVPNFHTLTQRVCICGTWESLCGLKIYCGFQFFITSRDRWWQRVSSPQSSDCALTSTIRRTTQYAVPANEPTLSKVALPSLLR